MMKAPVSLIPHFIRDFDANMMSIKDGLFNQTVAEFNRHMMGVWVRHCDFSQYVEFVQVVRRHGKLAKVDG